MTYRELNTLGQIKAMAEVAGNRFFEASTMRFFRSRISEGVYPTGIRKYGTLFVTSELDFAEVERRYTIRRAYDDPDYGFSIRTIGEFREYLNRRDAHLAARRLRDCVKAVHEAFESE